MHISSKTASSPGWVIHFTKIKSVLRGFSDILKAQIEKIMFQRKGKLNDQNIQDAINGNVTLVGV